MKIVDAVWEKRNLGVTCCEIMIDSDDTTEDVQQMLHTSKKYQYVVFKVASSRPDIVRLLQDEGYRYIECLLTTSLQLKDFKVPAKYKTIVDKCSLKRMDDKDIKFLCDELDKRLFHTDRVYIDPYFSHDLAANRYKNWMLDLVHNGIDIYKVVYEGDDVGFVLYREIKPNVYDGILVGVYSKYANSGMGYCVECAGVVYYKSIGAKKIIGRVSTNNPDAVKVVSSFGNVITRIDYIFVMHNDVEE